MAPANFEHTPHLNGVTLIERLGDGVGLGRFKARLRNGECVAFLPGPIRSGSLFVDWARRFQELKHPNLPKLLKLDEEAPYLAWEYLEGENLEVRLALRGEALPEVEALSMILQVASALLPAHRAGLSHGGLTARSILFSDGRPSGRQIQVVGWSPQSRPLQEGIREDIRALGVLLFQALTGAVPPSRALPEGIEKLEGTGGFFDDVLMDWVEVERDLDGLGKSALETLSNTERFADLSSFIDEVAPLLQSRLDEAHSRASRSLQEKQHFRELLERHRVQARELERRLDQVRDWFQEHAKEIEEIDSIEAQDFHHDYQSIEQELYQLLEQNGLPPVKRAPSSQRSRPLPASQSRETAPFPSLGLGGMALPQLFHTPQLEPLSEPLSEPLYMQRSRVQESALDVEPIEAPAPPPLIPTEPSSLLGLRGLFVALALAMSLGVGGAAFWLTLGSQEAQPSETDTGLSEDELLMLSLISPDTRPLRPPVQDMQPQDRPPALNLSALDQGQSPSTLPDSQSPEPPPLDAEPSPLDVQPLDLLPLDIQPLKPPSLDVQPVASKRAAPSEEKISPPEGMSLIPEGFVNLGLSEAARTRLVQACHAELIRFRFSEEKRAYICAMNRLLPEGPPQRKHIPRFFLMQREVNQREYRRCRQTGICRRLKEHWPKPDYPATTPNLKMAQTYCAWRGWRLPSAEEWVRAARGDDERLYPWGDAPPSQGDFHRSNHGRRLARFFLGPSGHDGHKYPSFVGAIEADLSPFGISDMGGNVREWTSSFREGKPLLAGGSWKDPGYMTRVTLLRTANPKEHLSHQGFRCAADYKSGAH